MQQKHIEIKFYNTTKLIILQQQLVTLVVTLVTLVILVTLVMLVTLVTLVVTLY